MIGELVTAKRTPSRHRCDTYFVQTCDVLLGMGIDPDEFAWQHTTLLLKPDAAVTGGMRRAVAWLSGHGYRIVGAHAVALTPLHIRALWYFNWHKATPQRRRLADQLSAVSRSIVLIVRHPDGDLPVSVRLTTDKGPADPSQRLPGQLRYALGAGTYLLNQVHSPDDPDDVLRELSIYFGEPELAEFISACRGGSDRAADAASLARQVESGVVHKSADLDVARDAIWPQLQDGGWSRRPGTGPEWMAALDAADRRHLDVDPWFRLVIEAAYLPMQRRTEDSEK